MHDAFASFHKSGTVRVRQNAGRYPEFLNVDGRIKYTQMWPFRGRSGKTPPRGIPPARKDRARRGSELQLWSWSEPWGNRRVGGGGRDITEQKRAEEALAQERTLFAACQLDERRLSSSNDLRPRGQACDTDSAGLTLPLKADWAAEQREGMRSLPDS